MACVQYSCWHSGTVDDEQDHISKEKTKKSRISQKNAQLNSKATTEGEIYLKCFHPELLESGMIQNRVKK